MPSLIPTTTSAAGKEWNGGRAGGETYWFRFRYITTRRYFIKSRIIIHPKWTGWGWWCCASVLLCPQGLNGLLDPFSLRNMKHNLKQYDLTLSFMVVIIYNHVSMYVATGTNNAVPLSLKDHRLYSMLWLLHFQINGPRQCRCSYSSHIRSLTHSLALTYCDDEVFYFPSARHINYYLVISSVTDRRRG